MIKTKPPRENMRYQEVINWVKESGVSEFEVRRLIEKGVIPQHFIPPFGKHAWYNADEVKQAFDGNRSESEKPK